MQTKKDTQRSRRLQSIAKLYSPEPKPVFNIVSKTQTPHKRYDAESLNYAAIVQKELVKSLGLTLFFIVLQCILYFTYFKYL